MSKLQASKINTKTNRSGLGNIKKRKLRIQESSSLSFAIGRRIWMSLGWDWGGTRQKYN